MKAGRSADGSFLANCRWPVLPRVRADPSCSARRTATTSRGPPSTRVPDFPTHPHLSGADAPLFFLLFVLFLFLSLGASGECPPLIGGGGPEARVALPSRGPQAWVLLSPSHRSFIHILFTIFLSSQSSQATRRIFSPQSQSQVPYRGLPLRREVHSLSLMHRLRAD